MENNQQFNIGDRVVIARNVNKEREEDGESYGYLDQHIGTHTTIIGYNDTNQYGELCWFVDIDYRVGQPLSICEKNLDLV